MKAIKKYFSEIIGIIICLSSGMFIGYITHAGTSPWYSSLQKPNFNPPDWIFSPVWTILYIMIGIALGKIWNARKDNTTLLYLFITHLTLNVLWTPLFFYAHRIDIAFIDIVLLWLSLITCMILGRKIPYVSPLLVPYFAWVSFALILNWSMYVLNV